MTNINTFQGNVGIGSTTPGYALTVRKNTNTLLLESENGGTNADVNIDFKSYDSQDPVGARISAKDDSAFGSDILFSTRTGENGALTERMRIQGGGSIDINGYIRHIGDENNLFGFSGTDTFKIATAGADRLTVGANGTVTLGVNMEIPDYIHHVGDSNNYFGFSAADTFKITTANVDRLTVASNGTVTLAQGLSTSVTPGTYLTGSAYNGATARTFAVDATTAATASKVVARDTSADIHARLFRPNYADQSGISGAMAYRINNSNDSYIRFCSDTGNIRTFLNVPTRTGGDASGSWAITAAQATKVQVTRDDTGDTAMYLTMAPDNTAGQKSLYMDTNLIYDNTNNRLRLKQVMFGDQNVYGLGGVTGDYGTVQTIGTGEGSNEGYSINGHWVFMSSTAASCGIYNDSNNEWMTKWNQNGSTDLYYNGANRIQTTNTGVHVTGDVYADHMYIDDYLYHNGDDNTRIGFGTDTIYMRTAGTDRLTISSAGNVTLQASMYIPNYIYHVGDNNTYFGFPGNDTFRVATSGTARITVNSSGNVGIKRTDPGQALDVWGNIKINNYIQGQGQSYLYFHPNNEPKLYSASHIAFNFATNGYAYAVLWVSTSDRRLKKNIKPLSNAIDTIKKLNPVHYDKRYSNNDVCDEECTVEKCYNKEDGFIAQEVQAIPELAHSVSHSESSDILGLNYNSVLTYCVKAVQEQQEIIETEKTKVVDLLARVTTLENI